MLIVEHLGDGKRQPAYMRDKVMSLGDISIYTTEGEVPLAEVFEKVKAKAEGKSVDVKSFASDADIRAYFAEVLPAFDQERVYTTDIKKLLNWYDILLAAGITEFVEKEEEAEAKEEAPKTETAPKATKAPKAETKKAPAKAPKAATKPMKATQKMTNTRKAQ